MATTTKDGKPIGFDAIVTYRISDIEKAVLRVTLVKDAIVDTCMGIIGTELSNATWEDIFHGNVVEDLTEACRKRGWKWGIEIMQVQLAGVCLVKNIRLSGGSAQHMDIEHHTQ
jgi:regulator of protease activity HflC (stomatin/prohibitin superfamily)